MTQHVLSLLPSVCLYVCLSVTVVDRDLAISQKLYKIGTSTYPTLCRKGIQISPKIRALPARTLLKLWTQKILQLHVNHLRCCQLGERSV